MEKTRKSNFSFFSTIFCYLLLNFYVKTGTKFSFREKQLFEKSEVEITRVDYNHKTAMKIGTRQSQSEASTWPGPRV